MLKMTFKNTCYTILPSPNGVRLTIEHDDDGWIQGPFKFGHIHHALQDAFLDAFGQFSDHLQDAYGHSDDDSEYERLWSAAKAIRNEVLSELSVPLRRPATVQPWLDKLSNIL